MSGTSLDGIDAALVEIEGSALATKVKLIEFETLEYDEKEKDDILRICNKNSSKVDEICRMNFYLGRRMGRAALNVIEKAGKKIENIDFVSSHGQTIYHMPECKSTLQIGDISVIAAETGCITIGDFRPGDMAVGGQGAPLVPFVDFLLFRNKTHGRVLLNIGGISNVTVLKASAEIDDVIAFDTGPGNMIIDLIVNIATNGELKYDKNGQIALSGNVNVKWLNEILKDDEFLYKEFPKSTGRERYSLDFARCLWDQGKLQGLSYQDIISTVTEYTSESILINYLNNIKNKYSIDEIFVGGGGVHNSYLMNSLKEKFKKYSISVMAMESLNINSDAKEAIAFSILGNEFIHGNINNMPKTTGAKHGVVMGKLALP